ncbi:hypothetical protein PCAR4_210007 [Paraburkholderia caribensis]|nr:hypothetical protein PCAR4_210007 [Paraburkholderia caribensis]
MAGYGGVAVRYRLSRGKQMSGFDVRGGWMSVCDAFVLLAFVWLLAADAGRVRVMWMDVVPTRGFVLDVSGRRGFCKPRDGGSSEFVWHLRGAGGLVLGFALASAFCYRCFTRCPCAGRHLLFFAAAKKSRQKKAANTANTSPCLRAPTGSYASHGNFPVRVGCQRSCSAPHPRHTPARQRAAPDSPPPPRWQTVCRS